MTDILEKCAIAAQIACQDYEVDRILSLEDWREITRAVIATLADGVTEEMGESAIQQLHAEGWRERNIPRAISAAIRAALTEGANPHDRT